MANQKELAEALDALKQDMQERRFNGFKEDYENGEPYALLFAVSEALQFYLPEEHRWISEMFDKAFEEYQSGWSRNPETGELTPIKTLMNAFNIAKHKGQGTIGEKPTADGSSLDFKIYLYVSKWRSKNIYKRDKLLEEAGKKFGVSKATARECYDKFNSMYEFSSRKINMDDIDLPSFIERIKRLISDPS